MFFLHRSECFAYSARPIKLTALPQRFSLLFQFVPRPFQGDELEQQTETLRQRAGELEIGRAEFARRFRICRSEKGNWKQPSGSLDIVSRKSKTRFTSVERLGVTEERLQTLQEEARKFAARKRYLDEAESQLSQEKSELADALREVANQRRQLEEQAVRERRAISAQQQLAQTDLQQRTQQLEQREAEIDARENALAQMQAELRNTQREVLEMRLATEETWAQLSGALAPASLTRSIAQVRSKLADHYRTTIDELAERSEQLELVRGDLTKQLATLAVEAGGDERLGGAAAHGY